MPKSSEEKIRRLESELSRLRDYETLVEHSLTGIYIDQGGKIVFANDRFAEIYGYPREELIGMESRTLVHPEDRARIDRIRGKRLQGKMAPAEYEAKGITKSGRTIWVRRRNTTVSYRGAPSILGNVVDISREKAAEEELRKLNEDMKNLLQVVSHDLRTPVVAMHGLASRLLKTRKAELDSKSTEYLKRIMDCAERSEALIEDLRSLSRIGRIKPKFRDCSMGEILGKISSYLEPKLRETDAELILAGDFPVVRCDEERIYQVFENLIVNALKYAGKQPNPKIEVGCLDEGEVHRFYVRDNGPGIEPQQQNEIFRKFKRLKRTKKEKGTGLGLSIVKGIVENHGGRIWVESEKGRGSTFHFTLPKNPPERKGADSPSPQPIYPETNK